MARTRDVVIGLIIGVSVLAFVFFMGITLLMGFWREDAGDYGWGSKVALINLYGEIYSSTDIIRQLDRWADDGSVKAIVLHVNTPGGGVASSQEIYEKILKVRRETGKPVVVSMSSLCASGGYYIACAADRIVANPGTLTGSIGVVIQWPLLGEMFDKIGVQFETIKSGEFKDVGSPFREPTERDRAILQGMVDDTYQQFVDVVAEGRDMPSEDVLKLADGSVFSGRQAREKGLIDTLGTLEDALDIAGELAGIGKEPRVVKERPRRRVDVFDLLGSILGVDLSFLSTVKERKTYPQVMYIFN